MIKIKMHGNILIPFLLIFTCCIFGVKALAQIHKGISFQGVIRMPNGEYPSRSGITVNARILSPNNCILKEEQFTGVNISNGYLNLAIGTGAVGGYDPSFSLAQVMDNSKTISSLTCLNLDGSVNTTVTSFVPLLSNGSRKFRMSLMIDSIPVVADFNMRSMAYAVNAETLNGASNQDFIQVNSINQLTQQNVESLFQRFTKLDALLNNTNSNGAAANLGPLATLLPSGVASTTTFLRGDGKWTTVSGGIGCSAHQTTIWNSLTNTLACADINIATAQVAGLASSATVDTTNADNISSGTISIERLPASIKGTTWTENGDDVYRTSGKVGIGTPTPTELLSISGGNLIAEGVYGASGAPLTNPKTGTKMLWYPRKAAFRVGTSQSNIWNDASLGNYSFGVGYNTKAGGNSIAMGWLADARGLDSIALGKENTAANDNTVAIGTSNNVGAKESMAFGQGLIPASFRETVLGSYNEQGGSSDNNSAVWRPTNILLSIGNGESSTARSTAVTVLKNGSVGIGTRAPNALLDVNGAVRMGSTNANCDSSQEGSQRYNATLKKMEFCNGTAWSSLGQTSLECVTVQTTRSDVKKEDLVEATCPVNYTVTGGACRRSQWLQEPSPWMGEFTTNGFQCVGESPDGTGIDWVQTQARCCK